MRRVSKIPSAHLGMSTGFIYE